MERDILIREVVSFCLDYGVLIDKSEMKSKIDSGLEKTEFIEDLINTIFIKTKKNKHLDTKKVIELLLELEKVRLELEFKEHNKA